jgi:hypothetical protein
MPLQGSGEQGTEDTTTIAHCCALTVLIMGGIAFVLRLGTSAAPLLDSGADRAVMGGVGLGLLACTAPALLARARGNMLVGRLAISAALPVIIVAAAAILGQASNQMAPTFGLFAPVGILALGLCSFILLLLVGGPAGAPRAVVIGASLLLALWLASASWGGTFHSALFEVQLALGRTHVDTLFHASLGNMLLTYGVPSTGLDGPEPIPYHFMSHWLFGSLSLLFGCSVLAVYNLVYPIVFLPLFAYAALQFAAALGRSGLVSKAPPAADVRLRYASFFWALTLIGFVGVLPTNTSLQMGIWDNVLRGESFTLAVTVMFMCGSLVVYGAAQVLSDASDARASRIVLSIAAVVMLAVAGFLKVSVLFVLAPPVAYAFVRWQGYRRLDTWVTAIALALVLVAIHAVTRGAGGDALRLDPLHFLTTYVPATLRPFSAVFYFWWLLLYCVMRLVEERCRTVEDVLVAVRSRRAVDVELALILALASVLPGVLFALPSGAANYFSEVHRWVAFALVLGAVLRMRPRLFPLRTGKSAE